MRDRSLTELLDIGIQRQFEEGKQDSSLTEFSSLLGVVSREEHGKSLGLVDEEMIVSAPGVNCC